MKPKSVFWGLIVLAFVLTGGYFGAKIYVAGTIKDQIAVNVEKTHWIARLSYAGLDVSLFKSQVRVRNIEVDFKGHKDPLRVDQFILLDVDYDGNVPSRMHVVLEGMHLDPQQDIFSELRPTMAELDYGPVVGRLELSYQYDPQKKLLHIDRLKLSADDVGLVTGASRLNNLDLGRLLSGRNSFNAGFLIAVLPSVAFAGAEVTFENHSLAQRFFRAGAARNNRSVEEFTESTAKAYQAELGNSENARAREASAAIAAFVQNPNQIKAVAAPPKPIPLLRLLWVRSLADVIELLHIRVNAS